MEEMEEDIPSNTSSSDDEDNKLEQRASELEKLVCSNVYLYDTHVELCGLYKKLGDLNSMREAYLRFSKVYPLTANLWLEWIKVEVSLASSNEEKKQVLDLFKTAVGDYHSVKLWQEYCQFAIGNCTLEETRNIFDTGLNAVGLHVTEGSMLWNTLREFELAHLSLSADTEDFNAQMQRVTDVFRRQLSVSLLDMENTFNEWTDFIGQLPEDHGIDTAPVEWNYKKALKSLELYKPYEEKLMNCVDDEAEMFKIYKEYISCIKDPCLIVCTYERAVSNLCLNGTLWENYCYYSINLGELALTVSKKALRNCPWSIQLWVFRLKILEVNDKPEKEFIEGFEQAISAVSGQNPLELWLTYIEYLRRKEDTEKLGKLFFQAKEQINHINDPTNKLLRFQSRLLAKSGDMVAARKLWTEILQNPRNKISGNIWMEYLAWEKQFGQPKNVRTVYQRAISTCTDWSSYFADEWLLYEREFGNVTDVLNCMAKCKKIVKVPTNDDFNNKRTYCNDADTIEPKVLKKQKIRNNESMPHRDIIRNEKPANESPCIKVVLPPTDIDPPRTAFISNIRANITDHCLKELFPKAQQVIIPTDRKGMSRCFSYVVFENEEDAAEALTRDREPLDGRPMFISKCVRDKTERHSVFKYENKLERNKLFVKGLPRHYDQKAVENIFKPYGATGIRLVTKFNGQPKGLAYVDFANAEDAERAMKNTDQMALGEFTITVAVSAPPTKSKSVFAGQSKPISTVTEHPKNRLQIPLVPRALQVKRITDDQKPIAKSNEDFRNMINKST